MGKIHNEQESYSREMGLDQKIEYSSGNALYVGRAFPGALTSQEVWQIYKMAVDGDGNMTSLRFANKSDDFKFSWDLRATYSYVDI